MIERASEFGSSQTAPLSHSDSTLKTAGDMLREAREGHGLHIDVVAAALKVPTQKLQALEDDNIEALPDPVFARALAASVCRALRVDPAPVLAKLPGALRPGLADADRPLSGSFRSGAPRTRGGTGGTPSRALLVVVALLLAGAAALVWLPSGAFEQLGQWVSGFTAGDRSASASDTAAVPQGDVPAGTVVEPVALPPPSEVPAAPAEAASSAVVASAAAAASAPAAASVGGNALVFAATAESWITVTDATGKSLLRRTVTPGETVGVNGTLPLSVVVGRAAGVTVQVKGKPFDLTPLARSGGVARFEVKP
ncbi:helix-turn-helix domain-containing protein [Variovorax sp. LT1P1]|uniref:helix-turn-helix domain-containing protein n=1 Tax=Variovorax sp. LT1P1 TaxID=3443730 RepID=UPI003F488694